MSRQYYYLVAGLPDILLDDTKMILSPVEYRSFLAEHLPVEDFDLIRLYFWPFDHQNLLNRLKGSDEPHAESGNLSAEMLEQLLAAAKDASYDSLPFKCPSYLPLFIDAYKAEQAIIPNKSWDLQLTELYFQHALQVPNKFVQAWILFEQKLGNVLTAYKCRENSLTIETQLVGNDEIQDKLIRSSARDFGLDSDELPYSEAIFRALETNELFEQEKRIDTIRWELLDEQSFFHYFSVEKLFTFLIKLAIIERWMRLDKNTGLEFFKDMLKKLETSYEFPADFSLK
ncbi:MAG: DUF2764 family protein [Bacteroidota bacterium]|nr:MAG: DUF2764 family protein [Bacteroidota bacterium]